MSKPISERVDFDLWESITLRRGDPVERNAALRELLRRERERCAAECEREKEAWGLEYAGAAAACADRIRALP